MTHAAATTHSATPSPINSHRSGFPENARLLNADLFYNPSRGFVADITQSFMQKTAGRFSPGSLETGYADVLQSLSKDPLKMISHSQGTATTTCALEILGRRGVIFDKKSSAIFLAPVTLTGRIRSASKKVRLLDQNTKIYPRKYDPVPLMTGTLNPVSHIEGWANFYRIEEHGAERYFEDSEKKGWLTYDEKQVTL